jgi:hypothetical protein
LPRRGARFGWGVGLRPTKSYAELKISPKRMIIARIIEPTLKRCFIVYYAPVVLVETCSAAESIGV